MKRRRSSRLVLVLAILALGAALTVMATRPHAPTATGPVYTLAQVEAGLSQHPQAWVGRTVLVRALLQYEPCPWRIANGYDAFKHISYYRYECYLLSLRMLPCPRVGG